MNAVASTLTGRATHARHVPIVVGYGLDRWHSWNAPLWSVAGFYVVAALCWTRVDARATLAKGEVG